MKKAPIPLYEADRLCAVKELKILDTSKEERFDLVVKQAIKRFDVPISTITIIDKDREWFKAMEGLSKNEGPRDISFCGHALLQRNLFIIEDTLKDPAFMDNPMVKGSPFIRFYAGKSLFERSNRLPIGVFCIKDTKPRTMTLDDINDFMDLATQAENEINKGISDMI